MPDARKGRGQAGFARTANDANSASLSPKAGQQTRSAKAQQTRLNCPRAAAVRMFAAAVRMFAAAVRMFAVPVRYWLDYKNSTSFDVEIIFMARPEVTGRRLGAAPPSRLR